MSTIIARRAKQYTDFNASFAVVSSRITTMLQHIVQLVKSDKKTKKKQRAIPILQALRITPSQLPEEAVTPVTVKEHSEPGVPLSLEHQALVELIADMNIPYTQLESTTWENFIHTLNPGFKIPKKDKFREIIIEHANKLLEEGLRVFRGHLCGFAVDGATIFSEHTYAFILVHPHGLRLAGIKLVDDQSGYTLGAATADIINDLVKGHLHGFVNNHVELGNDSGF